MIERSLDVLSNIFKEFLLSILMEKTHVFIDAGFLSKVTYKLGEGNHFKYDIVKFAKCLTEKENLIFKKLFYYNAPPFQSHNPTKEKKSRKERYDSFIRKLKSSGEDIVSVREGRCQRIKNKNEKYIYKQKGVDAYLIMDLMSVPLNYPKIKKVILIASDSDFVPVIKQLKQFGIDVILYTYFERNRKSIFSTSNFLLKSVHSWRQLKREDFLV